MENDLIYRGSVKTKVSDTWWDEIDSIPAVDAAEVRHGRWIECEDVTLDVYYRCSVCGNEWDIIEGTPEDNNMKYCPECGARMDGRREDGDGDV